MNARFPTAVAVAALVTFGLFWIMQALIGVEGELDEGVRGRVVDFVRLKREELVEEKKRKLPNKKPPEEAPPPPDLNLSQNNRPDADMGNTLAIMGTDIDLGEGPGLGSGGADTDIVPLVRVEPLYPQRASQRGIEGWVEVEFTISAAGTVVAPRVINYHPSTIFSRAALKAIRKWKYNPKIEEGKAVERPGVTVRLTFELKS
ncbi:MAG: energy transducer TonB [Myxococcota bacterium]